MRFGRRWRSSASAGVAVGLLGVMAAVELVPGRNPGGLGVALPLLVGGIGSRSDGSPQHHPHPHPGPRAPGGRGPGACCRRASGSARAAGIVAVVGSVYFAHLANHGRTDTAMQLGLLSAVGIIVVALVLAVRRSAGTAGARPEPVEGRGDGRGAVRERAAPRRRCGGSGA
ncbi:hypothetical protein LT493_01685 [Streptomyces tricolor]|nr:hypothetical protein [Streptomyces tricolor]